MAEIKLTELPLNLHGMGWYIIGILVVLLLIGVAFWIYRKGTSMITGVAKSPTSEGTAGW